MAFRRLINQYQTLMQNGDTQGIRNDRAMLIGTEFPTDTGAAFVDTAQMLNVSQLAGGAVFFRGRTAQARQVNDEPLQAGQVVLISRTRDGEYIIHGSDH